MNLFRVCKQLAERFRSDDTIAVNQADDTLNTRAERRNLMVVGLMVAVVLGVLVLFKLISTRNSQSASADEPVNFGAVLTPDFGVNDAQSAMQAQQAELSVQQKKMTQLEKTLKENRRRLQELSDGMDSRQQQVLQILDRLSGEIQKSRVSKEASPDTQQPAGGDQGARNPFGSAPPGPLPGTETPSRLPGKALGPPFAPGQAEQGIDSFDFDWAASKTGRAVRTADNYVPSGSFVTAVMTGGADANAGVYGQGDTAPIIFRATNKGFLPNGHQSHLKDCIITASTYGEVSSSRGIVRTDKLSCIFKSGQILDIPVRGTAFNFGRNGIRGTTVMRNGKIIQMAGISGFFTGLGDTAQAMSRTISESPLGTTSTVDPSKALQNLGGSALKSIGSKLADYYIGLAEQYHPIVELNPGNVVNIVFLDGFPLDPGAAASYEQQLAQESAGSPASKAAQMVESVTNPLIERLPPAVRAQAWQAVRPLTGSTAGPGDAP